ncbi:MAG: GMC family oxidoreductase [Verrucomicrobia bacterium]|nr:GMC family oxidoreductase [Verrucomicrobiota bacterium]
MWAFAFTSLLSPVSGAEKVYKADYVIVGVGAAGAEVAKILSDNHEISVIVLEAGANHDNDTPIKDSQFAPILESNFFPQYFYQLQQVVQENAPGVVFNYTTGRLFGGGTSINGEQYVEGTNQLYDKWEDKLGSFWSVEKIRRAFKKVEKYNGKTTERHERGESGAVDVRQAPAVPTSMATKFVNAVAESTGVAEILDYNIPQTELGPFTRWQLSQKPNGNRESSSTAFLHPVLRSDNTGKDGRQLRVLDKTTALRVLFNKEKEAIGVEALQDGESIKVLADKEVILCAGIYSPCLLQLSGIGPRSVLECAGVKVLFDNHNVGNNLVNQLTTVAVLTANPNDVGVPASDPDALYVGGAFLRDPAEADNVSPRGLRGVQLIGVSPEPGSFVIAIIASQPKSRGVVAIQSSDPFQIPLVDDRAFSNPADLETFKEIFRVYIKEIANQLNANDPLYNLVAPSEAVIDDDAALEAYILSTLDHTHHWTGSCQMGRSDRDGVTDKRGKVFGVKRLRVIDDSIAPFIPDGNTQACAYMLARRIGEDIAKRDRSKSKH